MNLTKSFEKYPPPKKKKWGEDIHQWKGKLWHLGTCINVFISFAFKNGLFSKP